MTIPDNLTVVRGGGVIERVLVGNKITVVRGGGGRKKGFSREGVGIGSLGRGLGVEGVSMKGLVGRGLGGNLCFIIYMKPTSTKVCIITTKIKERLRRSAKSNKIKL